MEYLDVCHAFEKKTQQGEFSSNALFSQLAHFLGVSFVPANTIPNITLTL